MATPYFQQQVLDAWARLGRTYAVRVDRNGSRKVSLDGQRETNMATAMRRIERTLAATPRAQWEG